MIVREAAVDTTDRRTDCILDAKTRQSSMSVRMNAEDQNADGPSEPTSKSGLGFLGLSRCENCYKHKAISWRGVDGESSSSAEDSGPEVESEEEEEESSSNSSCSEKDLSEILEESPASGDGEETSEAQEDESSTKEVTRRAPLVKSFSMPASLTPHLIPLSLLPQPQTVISTLHLQVEKHDEDAFLIVKQQLTEEEKEEEVGGGINNQRSQPTLQQHQLSYQYQQQPHQQFYQHQQQQPQHFPPFSARGQMLAPPLHTLPVLHHPTLNAPQRYPHSQPCLYCSSMQLPHAPYWSHCSNGLLHR